MNNLHKNPITWMGVAFGVFGVGATFFEQHCSVSPTDLITLAVGLSTFLSGYFHGKGTTTPQQSTQVTLEKPAQPVEATA